MASLKNRLARMRFDGVSVKCGGVWMKPTDNGRDSTRPRPKKNRFPIPMAGDKGTLAMVIGAPDQSRRKRFRRADN